MDHDITFNPNPVQKVFIESRADADVFSSRFGEGKSAALCWSIFHHTRYNPGAVHALIRDTWENLRDTTQKEFFHWFPPGICGNYIASQKKFVWTLDGMGKGEVQFLGMDDPDDAHKLQSRALAGFEMDEPAPAMDSGGISEEIFDIAMGRLRQRGMNYYIAKLAQNNPDEMHWTYRKFVDPGTKGYKPHQTDNPENLKNLPDRYYEKLREQWAHRPDLQRRFIDGKYGYTPKGRKVTPEFSENIHAAVGLTPVKNRPLTFLWDFGLNPTCIITQVTPLRHWYILESFVGDGIGVEELIEANVKPTLAQHYMPWMKFDVLHIGDPAGRSREQSSSERSAVRSVRKQLGGKWRDGPIKTLERTEPLKAVLRQTQHDTGVVRVDKQKAREVYMALRGGWHFKVAKNGIITPEPVKDMHSHPGDAMGYGAARLFPIAVKGNKKVGTTSRSAVYFGGLRDARGLGFEQPGKKLPKEQLVIGE